MAWKHKTLVGHRFGNLLVVGLDPVRTASKKRLWLCRCDCGEETSVLTQSLVEGKTKSCGCGNNRPGGVGHGLSGTDEYYAWHNMVSRCTDPANPSWALYGGRGITVCPQWVGSFRQFLSDMGSKPAPGLTLDRIDNERGYMPGNTRWATPREQAENRRTTRKLSIGNKTMSLAAWGRVNGVSKSNVYSRIRAGWTPIDAVSVPHGGLRPPVIGG